MICLFLHTPTPNILRRVWRYQRGNQIPYIEEEQTTQWPNEKVQKDKQNTYTYTPAYVPVDYNSEYIIL
jgi:hypothetical protein